MLERFQRQAPLVPTMMLAGDGGLGLYLPWPLQRLFRGTSRRNPDVHTDDGADPQRKDPS